MNKKYFLFVILIVFLSSCKNETKESAKQKTPDNPDAIKQTEEPVNLTEQFDKDQIIKSLEGKWKEPEYPFRKAEFKNQSVKFIEEGIAATPEFENFEISNQCPFDVNNIKNVNTNEIILSIAENKRCEKLKIEDDSLILSGYTNTQSNYEIVYKKMK